MPVFDEGRLIGFSVTTAHHLDIGALTPGSCGIVDAIDAYAEGLQFKAIKVDERGGKNDMVWQIMRDNIRASDLVVGDMEAQIAAARIGAERFVELVERYGLRDGRRRLRGPDGLFRAADAAGDRASSPTAPTRRDVIDGYLDSDEPSRRTADRRDDHREGDELTVDLTGTAPQVPDRPINMPFEGTVDIAIWLTLRSILLDSVVYGHIPRTPA